MKQVNEIYREMIEKLEFLDKDRYRINENGEMEKFCKYGQHWVLMNEEYFYKHKNGFHTYCKECNKKKSRIWAKENPEKARAFKKKNKRKPNRLIAQREYCRVAREEGYNKRYWEENKEKFKKYSKDRQHKNHNISKLEWKNCQNYFNYECSYCGLSEEDAKDKYKQRLHKEHAVHNGANDLSNCIPACKSCNSLKSKKSLNEWYNENNPLYNKQRYLKILKWLNEDYLLYIDNK